MRVVGRYGLGLVLALGAGGAFAQEATVNLDIPPQSLASAMDALAKQAKVKTLYPDAAVQDRKSPGVHGKLTLREAVAQLLAGTGLSYSFPAENTVVVKAPEANSSRTLQLPGITVAGQDPVETGYAVRRSSTATKTDTPIMETPVSIQAISREVMDDQQVIRVRDALKNVSSVQAIDDFYDNFIIRGFDTDNSTYRNGLKLSSLTDLETANLEQIDILKGPAAVLFGRVQPGGLVNLVPKRPLDQPYYSVQQQLGSFDLYRTTLDATGPVTPDRSLLYRVNFAYKDTGSFRDFVGADHVFVAPSLTWRPTDRFSINTDFEYQHDSFVWDHGIIAIGDRPGPFPISRYLSDGIAQKQLPATQDRILAGFDWSYRFNDDWKLTNRFQYTNTDYYQFAVYNVLVSGTDLPPNLGRGLWNVPLRRSDYGTNLDLTGKFDTGLLRHDTLVGFDYYHRVERDGPGHLGPAAYRLPAFDVFNPVYGQVNIANLGNDPRDINFSFIEQEDWYGVYFQDQITLWDKVHILGGGRYDWASWGSATGTGDLAGLMPRMIQDQSFSPRVGILYQPWLWLSLYGNYTESFGTPNSGISIDGKPFPAETATEYEVGVKAEFFDKKLISTLAFYDLTKNNILEPNPIDPTFSVASGEATSRGIEFDFSGQLTRNWSVIGSYAYDDVRFTKDAANQGNRLPSVPRHSANIWTKYEIDSGALRGLGFGTGVFFRGDREGDPENTYLLPAYARWDASVVYRMEPFGSPMTTQLNVYNLLDTTYYERSSGTRRGIHPGAPLTFIGSVKLEF